MGRAGCHFQGATLSSRSQDPSLSALVPSKEAGAIGVSEELVWSPPIAPLGRCLPSLVTSLELTGVSGQPLRAGFIVPFPNLFLDSCKDGSENGFWTYPGPKPR